MLRRRPPPDSKSKITDTNVVQITTGFTGGKPKPPSPWKPGQSGNPSGKPKGIAEINAIARTYCPEAMELLAKWMRSTDPKVSVPSIIAMLNRGLGMPMQATEVTGKDGTPLAPPSLTVSFVAAPKPPPEQVTTIDAQEALEADPA